jgi:lipoprotein-anchoring transpeptidase ErfK/SrfK
MRSYRFSLLLSGLLLLFPFTCSALPSIISPPGEKMIVVDPRAHVWGAYSADGRLIRSGLASAGASWCKDTKKPCRTKTGSYRIYSLGDKSCISTRFPLPHGGAPMPYCMYFNGFQALHGSPHVVAGNISHGCVRLRVSDARWLRYEFVGDNTGTLVVIQPY